MAIHSSAIVDPRAEIDPSAEIGAYCVVDGPVRIGAETRVFPHTCLSGATVIGRNCEIHSFVSIGDTPQDRAFKPCVSYCNIGDDCIIREGVTIHRGTAAESTTQIGSRCMLMANAHVGHNCIVGDDVVLVNGALLAGHVRIGSRAFLSGNMGVHQFVRIGELAILGGVIKVVMDVPPFFSVGRHGTCGGINVIGLRRAGYSASDRLEIKDAFQLLYRSGRPFRAAVEELSGSVKTDAGRRLVEFLQAPSKRGIVSGRARQAHARLPDDEDSADQ